MGSSGFDFDKRIAYLLIPSIVILFAIYIASLISITIVSFTEPRYEGGTIREFFSISNYVEFFSTPAYVGFLLLTLRIAILSTALAVILAYPLAYYIARHGVSRWAKVMLTLIILSFLTSPLVKVYAWVIMLGSYGMVNTTLSLLALPPINVIYNQEAVIIGLTHFLIPFAVLVLVGPIRNIDQSVIDAAKSLGAGPVKTFFLVTLPLSLPGILAATLLGYTLGVSAFVIPMVLGGGKVNMLANLIYDRYVETFNPYFASAMSVTLFFIALSSAYLLSKVISRWLR